ncbi:NAD-dependent epimerase/dehydratase family protein [Kitasatospora sp. NPDC057904]|uniref:NAD-dependent epimerase/dehydratase family protein n=1 Tax=Kitasatospora sp. NPDC057904 TaxID=3346275 RepID=UPI0036DBC153
MRILVMGGTWFLGRAVVADALARGWSVTTFNRGLSGTDVLGVQAVHGDRTSVDDLNRLAEYGPWDAVVDTSASELPPSAVLKGARTLEPVSGTYVYISTVSVYAGWPDLPLRVGDALLDGPPHADKDYGRNPEGWQGPNLHYGRQKAGCERAVLAAFGGTRACVLRPGVILGPGEYIGRLPWWLSRAQRGGPILAPAPADRLIQPVDVRDVAAFALDRSQARKGGAYNVAHPEAISFAGFIEACLEVTGGSGRPVWAAPEALLERGVKEWTELPLWRTHAGAWAVDASSAVEAGLRCRPLRETIADTWAWWQADGRPVDHPRWADHGIDPDKEAKILASLN